MTIFKSTITIRFLIILSSCDPAWKANVTIYATNNTADNYLIRILDKTDLTLLESNFKIYDIEPEKLNIQLENYLNFSGTGLISSKCMELIIYNKRDSTFILLDNCDNHELYLKYVNEDYSNMPKRVKNNSINECDLDVVITISNEMLKNMHKDTAYTESILGLIKQLSR